MFEFDQFQEEVLSAYLRKKAAGELPSQLVTLKRANLRNYIRGRVARGYDKKDDAVLKEYFNPDNQYASLNESIHRFDIDKFRPLISYLKLETTSRDDNISKLLAWLIDFEPRPFEEWQKARNQVKETDNVSNVPDSGGEEAGPYTCEVGGGSSTTKEVIVSDPINEGPNGEVNDGGPKGEIKNESTIPEPPAAKPNQKRIRIIVILITCVLVIGVLFLNGFGSKHYMYWDGQQYIATSYKEEYSGIDLVPLNRHKLNNFRKIMRPDTLDQDDEKKVWYSKIDKHVEFFTMSGFHPVKRDRSLKAATREILAKYAGDNARLAN